MAEARVRAAPAAGGRLRGQQPPPAGDWVDLFERERIQRHSRWDRLAGAVFLTALVAARWRIGELPTAAGEVHGIFLLFLTVAVMMISQELVAAGLPAARSTLVLLFKLTVGLCPLFPLAAQSLLNAPLALPAGAEELALVPVLLHLVVAGHTALLLLLGTTLRQSLFAEALSQVLLFVTLSAQTNKLCESPFVRSLENYPSLGILDSKRGCAFFMSTAQLWVGLVLPLLKALKRESAAAVQFARQHGIPFTDRRLRAYTWLDRATDIYEPVNAVFSAMLVTSAAGWLRWAWTHYGEVYGESP